LKINKKKLLTSFLKIVLSIFLLYFVFTKISFIEIWKTVKSVKAYYLLLAVLFFILSQWVSAKRFLLFLKESGYHLSSKSNYILYLIGMFYNFFIPGGIGGDAYKIYILNKNFGWNIKKLTASVFLDRFMGLTAIGVLILILAFQMLEVLGLKSAISLGLIPLGILLIIVISFFFSKHFFPLFINIYKKTLAYSFVIQLLQVLSVICIILSLGDSTNFINYILIFLVSSVLSIFSFSGIGIREYVFYQASLWLGIESSTAVSIGLLFSISTAFVSLFGILYHYSNPKLILSKR